MRVDHTVDRGLDNGDFRERSIHRHIEPVGLRRSHVTLAVAALRLTIDKDAVPPSQIRMNE